MDKRIPKEAITEAAEALYEEMGEPGPVDVTLSYAAQFLLQHSVNRHNPYGSGNKFATRWAYRLAQAAIYRLKKDDRIKTFYTVGLRKEEVKAYERKEA